MKSVTAIVLAAGRSRRMGTQKLLLPIAGRTVIERVIDAILTSSVRHTLLVVGRDRSPILAALGHRPVTYVTNPHDERDMLSSARCGLRALPPETEAVLTVPGDQAGLTAVIIDTLLRALPTRAPGIVVPTHTGRRGHPLLFSREYADELLGNYDGFGLRGLLRAHAPDVLEVALDNVEVLDDIDTPEDYHRVRERIAVRQSKGPSGEIAG